MDGPATLTSATRAPAAVAACLCGQVRTFVRHDVRNNIRAAMIDPIRRETDVFATLSFNATASRWVDIEGMSTTGIDEVRGWLDKEFSVVDFAVRDDPAITNGITVQTPCLSLIERYETNVRSGRLYKWVMRLRTDAAYGKYIPPYVSWPHTRHHAHGTLYTTSCGPAPYDLTNEERRDGVCARIKPLPPRHLPLWAEEKNDPAFANALGCVKDAWGLMTRPAAAIYFSRALLEGAMNVEAPAHNFSCLPQSNWYHECGLGCALHL